MKRTLHLFANTVLTALTLVALLSCGGKEKPVETPEEKEEETTPEEEETGKPADYTITAEAGWDIYTAGTYRYGPSIMINEDGSIDAWFAATGSTYAADAGVSLFSGDASTPINLSTTEIGLAFTVDQPFAGVQASCPTWNTNGTESMDMALYKWDTSYEQTKAGTAVAFKHVVEMIDNAWNQLGLEDGSKIPAGRYLLVLNNGSKTAGVWYSSESAELADLYLKAYKNGSETSGAPKVILLYEDLENANGSYWDQISYQHSTDGGKSWTKEEMVLKPTNGSRDALSCCDPGVVKIGDYYYLGYTSTEHTGGLENHLYMSRGKSPKGPWEKWNGTGWGGKKVEPIVTYTGVKEKWGVGEPSMVVKDNVLYVYYTWTDNGNATRLATAPADDPLWPANLTQKGTVINKSDISGADHCDVKYCDAMGKFIAIHTASRMSSKAYVQIWTSSDGVTFVKGDMLTGQLGGGLHNIGISGDPQGHIDLEKQQYIGYAYGLDENGKSSWGKWNTKWNPLKFTKK